MSEALASAAFVGVLTYLGMLALVLVSHVLLVLVLGNGGEETW